MWAFGYGSLMWDGWEKQFGLSATAGCGAAWALKLGRSLLSKPLNAQQLLHQVDAREPSIL